MKTDEGAHHESKWISLDRRLRLGSLPPQIRSYTVGAVAVALFACLAIVLSGLGFHPFGAIIEIPDSLSPLHSSLAVPLSLIYMMPIGMGLVAGALFYASYQPGWRLALLTRLAIGALTLAFPLAFVEHARNIRETGIGPGLAGFVIVLLSTACGAAALICAVISSPRATKWAPRFATASFLGISLAFLMFKMRWDSLAQQIPLSPDTILVIRLPIVIFISYLIPFVWLVGVIFFWQAITEVKIFSREIGTKIADLGLRFSWLLGVLFAVKFIWLFIGYWGVIHRTALGTWQGSGQDGPLAWLLATLFAIAAGWWLTHTRKPVGTNSFTNASLLLTVGFLLMFIAAFLLVIPATVLTELGLEEIGLALGRISATLAGIGLTWTILFASLLLPLGLVFLRWQRFRYLALPLILSGLWALPSVIQQLASGSNLSFEYLTFDTMLTIMLLVLATLVWRGKHPTENTWIITLILVVSTLTALAESLIPEKYDSLGFALLLVVPITYRLLFDSTDLNEMGASQGRRLIRTVAFQAGFMLVVAASFILGLVSPAQLSFEKVADKIFLPPMLGLFLVAAISSRQGIRSPKPE